MVIKFRHSIWKRSNPWQAACRLADLAWRDLGRFAGRDFTRRPAAKPDGRSDLSSVDESPRLM